jgi:hypothetical protein
LAERETSFKERAKFIQEFGNGAIKFEFGTAMGATAVS